MSAITVHHIPEAIHCALEQRASQNGRSMEAEIRDILAEAVRDEKPVKIGSELEAFGQANGGLDLDYARIVNQPV